MLRLCAAVAFIFKCFIIMAPVVAFLPKHTCQNFPNLGYHFVGPGLETWLPPDSCRRKKWIFACASFRVAFSASRGLPRRRSGHILQAFECLLELFRTCENLDSVQYILKKSRYQRSHLKDTPQKRLGSVLERLEASLEWFLGTILGSSGHFDGGSGQQN